MEIVKAADEEGEHTESIDRKPLLPVGHATSDAGHAIAPPLDEGKVGPPLSLPTKSENETADALLSTGMHSRRAALVRLAS